MGKYPVGPIYHTQYLQQGQVEPLTCKQTIHNTCKPTEGPKFNLSQYHTKNVQLLYTPDTDCSSCKVYVKQGQGCWKRNWGGGAGANLV